MRRTKTTKTPAQIAKAYDDARALARAGKPLAPRHLQALVKLEHTAYYYHLNRGAYDFLKLKVPVAGCQFSGVLTDKWLNGEPVADHFFGRKLAAVLKKRAGGHRGPTRP